MSLGLDFLEFQFYSMQERVKIVLNFISTIP